MNMSEQDERIATVQSSVMLTVIKSELERHPLPDDATVKNVFAVTAKWALKENWMEPPAPAQLVLATAVTATNEWLKEHKREHEAEGVMFEAKVLFRLMNDPGTLHELFAERDTMDGFTPAGLGVVWADVCEAEGFNKMTARPL